MEIDGQPTNPDSAMYAEMEAVRNETTELPEGHSADAEAAEQVDSVEASTEGETEDTSQVQKVIYDGQEFATEKEAYEYMQVKLAEAEREKLILEARQEGIEAALSSRGQESPQVAAPEEPEDDSDEFYSDPTGYMKKQASKLEEQIRQKLKAENDMVEADRREWNDFFTRHPDLADFKDDCQHALSQNLDTIRLLAAKDKKKAQDFLATKAREKFQRYIEAAKPRTQLTNQRNAASSGINPGSVTPSGSSQEKSEPLDMISQMRSLRR